MMVEKILDISDNLLKNYKWDLFIEKRSTLTADSKNLSIDKFSKAVDIGFSVRVEKNKKVGFSYGTVLTEKEIEETVRRAMKSAEISDIEYLPLQVPLKTEKVEYFDTFSVFHLPETDKIKKAIEIEEKAYILDERIKTVRNATFTETVLEKYLFNSEGLHIQEKGSIYSATLAAMAEDRGDSQITWGYTASRFLGRLNIDEMVKETVSNAVSLLGSKQIKTQRIDILFPSYTMSELLEQFFPIFSGESFIKGKTPLSEYRKKKIFPDFLSLIDNGRLKEGISTYTYDYEGTPTSKTPVIENGIFKQFLHNLYTADISGEKSTGNAVRTFKTFPQVGYTNFFIEKTGLDIKKFLKGKTFLKVIELIGLHTSDVITGDFSVGVSGVLFVYGEPVQSVKEITLAGNFIDLLRRVEAVGNDLKFYGSVGSPSVFVKDMIIAGL